jgi:pimeloyl-ACP methyl ester carboxylesterase
MNLPDDRAICEISGMSRTLFRIKWGKDMAVVSAGKLFYVSHYLRSFSGVVKTREIRSENYAWRYLCGGDPAKPAIVFLHGFTGSASEWRAMMHCLAPDYQVIALDLPGLCSGHTTQDSRYDILRLATCLNEFVCALELNRFHLIGHSFGAAVAAMYAARYTANLQSLALVSLVARDDSETLDQNARWAAMRDLLAHPSLGNMRRLATDFFADSDSIPRSILHYKLRKLEAHGKFHLQVWDDFLWSMPFLKIGLPFVPANTLLINGSEDVFQANVSNKTSAFSDKPYRQKSRMVVKQIPHCGHFPLLEAPAELTLLYSDYLLSCGRLSEERLSEERLPEDLSPGKTPTNDSFRPRSGVSSADAGFQGCGLAEN